MEDILIKHHSQIELTNCETSFWNTFDPETKFFLLTGDPWHKVILDSTKFTSFEDCPQLVAAQPIPLQPTPIRQVPILPLLRPLPFGPPTQLPNIVDCNRRTPDPAQTDSDDDSNSDQNFLSPDTSPEVRPSRKDLKRANLLSNQILATEPQNFTRNQRKRRQRTPPARPNQWPPPQPLQDEDIQRGSCIQQ